MKSIRNTRGLAWLATAMLTALAIGCSDDSATGSGSADAASDATASDGSTIGDTSTTDAPSAGDAAADDAAADDATTPPQDAGEGDATISGDAGSGDAGGCAGKPKPAKTCCSGDVETSVVCDGAGWGCPSGYNMVASGDCGKPLPDAGSTDVSSAADTKTSLPWTGFQINRGWGPCPPGQVCSESWHVGLDGTMAIDKKGNKTTSKMSADDLKMLKEWMAQSAFADGMTKGFSCKPPPTDIGISFTVYLSGVKHTKTVTGCILSGPVGNIAKDIFDLVTKY